MPIHFKFTEPCCLNYDLSNIIESNLETEDIISREDIPVGTGMSMSQHMSTLQEDNSITTCDSNLNDHFQMLSNDFHCNKTVVQRKEVYKELIPVFKELVQALELECSVRDINRIKEIMTVEIVNAKENFLSKHPRNQRGRMVSSHVPSYLSRKNKHNGR